MTQEVTVSFPIFDWRGSDFQLNHCETVQIEDNEVPATLEEAEA